MLTSTPPAAPRLVLMLKAGPAVPFAHTGKHALYGDPPRWHKVTAEKPAPKGAPVAAHPKAAGHHEAAAHFTDEQWAALQLPASNVNAPSFNKALAKLRAWSDAGDVTAIVGAGYGTNTYGQKLVKVANHLLGLHGSNHLVMAGQGAGTHAAALNAAPADPHPTGLPEFLAPKAKTPAPPPEPVPAPAPPPAAAPASKLKMPDFAEGKTVSGVKALYEKVGKKIIDHAHAGNAAVVADLAEPEKKMWQGKTPNSKKLLALHAAAMAHAQAAVADAPYSIQAVKQGNTGYEGGVNTIHGPDFSGIEAALGLQSGDLADTDSTTYIVTNHKGQTFHVYKHAGALSVRTAGKNDNNGTAADLVTWLKTKQEPDGPKEGDTKSGADGASLVFKNGRWHKYVDTDESGEMPPALVPVDEPAAPTSGLGVEQLKNLQSIPWYKQKLPVENSNAKSHNAAVAKIEAMAFAGDTAGLQAFIDSKAAAKQTYAKKQGLLAQTALAALGGKATAAVATEPAGYDPVPPETSHFKMTGALMVDAFKNKDIASLQDFTQQMAASDNKDAQAWHKYGADALAALGVAHVPTAGDAPLPEKHKEALETLATEGATDSLQSIVNGNGPAAVKAHAKKLLARLAMTAEPPSLAGKPAYDHLAQAKAAKGNGIMPMKAIDEWQAANPGNDGEIAEALTSLGHAAMIPGLGLDLKPPEPVKPVNVTVTASKLTHTTDGHNKFWAVSKSPDGKSVMTTYGKIGSKGSATVKTFPTTTAAQAEVNKLLAEKLNKGYKPAGATDHTHEVGPKEGDTKAGADGMLVLKDGHWVKVADENNAGNWVFNAEDMGMSGASTIGNDAGLIAYHPEMGAEYHTDASMQAGNGEPELAAGDLKALVQKMADGGHVIPPLAMLQKLDFAFKASDIPGSAPAPEPSTGTAPPAMDDWKQTGPQGGSNPGGRFRDPSGQEWYCKFPGDADMARSEVLAAKLYALAGLASQDAMLITKGGKIGIASKWTEVKKAGTAAKLAAVDGALSGFAVDAWLGNWDVVGMGLDNLQVGADGKAVRVDAGGSLEYRAQGAKKPFGTSVTEIDTLRDKKLNPHSAAVFAKMTVADLSASAAKVVLIEDSQIRALVAEHGPGGEFERKALAATLIARKNDLQKRFPKAGKTVKKRLDPTALPIDGVALPKVHDFENWNGPGKGLSSKDFVNKANAVVEHQIRALAATGNLVALQALKFAQVDVSTGAPTGAMLPISAHPSKHVVQYHSDLVQLLDEVANPPEPLKVFQETEVGTLASLAAAFPPKPFGTTVDKVSSNEKMGFWVALGKVSGVAKFRPKTVSNYSAHAIAKASEKYKTASKLAKHFMSSIQSSGSYNDLFRDGKTHDSSGNSLKDVAKAALAHATEMPEGTSLYRWQKMSPKMLEHIMSAEEGTVFQATGPMCTSYSDSATKGFGTHRVAIRYAKGAKAVESFGSGKFSGEKEVTTLPNARFVILSRKMVPDVEHGNPTGKRLELEVLMLPPDLGL